MIIVRQTSRLNLIGYEKGTCAWVVTKSHMGHCVVSLETNESEQIVQLAELSETIGSRARSRDVPGESEGLLAARAECTKFWVLKGLNLSLK